MTNDLFQTDINLNQEAMELWLDYRKQLKKPYKTQYGIQEVVSFLSGFDPDTQMAMVKQSMKNEWQGIFELKKTQAQVEKEAKQSFQSLHDNVRF